MLLNYGAAAPQCHAQATSHQACNCCCWFAHLGGQNERDRKIEGRGGCLGPKGGCHFANMHNNPLIVSLGNGGGVREDVRPWWNAWGGHCVSGLVVKIY
jgi:hypothetical protein